MLLNRAITGAAVIALFAIGTAHAEFQLDPRFTDSDGDLIADIPTDPSQLVDPGTLIFAYTPVEDPAVYAEVWQGFLEHMEELTGKPVQFFPVQSNAAQIEAMRAGRLHVAGFNTGSNPLAVACAGFRPFAMMAAADGSFGYEMEIITYPGSGIEAVEDLAGRTLAFTSETSNSGFKAPSALLRSEFGMEAGTDFEPAFSGAHDNSILGVANQDYDAAAIANSVKARMIDREVVTEDQLVTIYTSQTFPTTGYGVVYNLTPELQEKIKEAFFSFDWEGTALAEEFGRNGEDQFIPITFQEDWAVIRQIDEANGVSYTCN
jgi:phosphonate transport system substrate-binding protein